MAGEMGQVRAVCGSLRWREGSGGTASGIFTVPEEKRECFGHRCIDIGKPLVDLACEHIESFLRSLN